MSESTSSRGKSLLTPLTCKYCKRPFHDMSRWLAHHRRHKVRIQSYWPRVRCKTQEELESTLAVPTNLSLAYYHGDVGLLNSVRDEQTEDGVDYFGSVMMQQCIVPITKSKRGRPRLCTPNKQKGVRNSVCSLCLKAFLHSGDLRRHMLTHTKEKPYTCKYCGRGFSQSTNLDTHVRVKHTKEMPFGCQYCPKKFSRACDVRIHERRVHTKEQLDECAICGKNFANRSSLMIHEMVHAKVKPYGCQYCGKRFTRSGDLNKHERTHTREKPFSCQYCHKKFSSSSCVTRHEWTHTRAKQYSCKVCNKGFSRLYLCKAHEEKDHG